MKRDTKRDECQDMEIFKIVKQTRDFEIEMFWKRTNYFLLLNSAVGGGLLLSLENFCSDTSKIMLFFSFIGCFVSLAWIKIGLGSKYWQSHWEQVLIKMQEKVGLGELNFFGTERTKERVMENLKMDSCFDSLVLCKPSVSRWMHRTACFFFIVWFCVFCFSIYNINILSCLEGVANCLAIR